MELTKSSRFEYGNTAITLQRLAIVNPVLLKTYFTANSSFILSEEALECVKKIRNRLVRIKILAIDTYRKKLVKERKENELYNSSDNLMMGNYGNYAFRMYIKYH
jgi:hypothetical protein